MARAHRPRRDERIARGGLSPHPPARARPRRAPEQTSSVPARRSHQKGSRARVGGTARGRNPARPGKKCLFPLCPTHHRRRGPRADKEVQAVSTPCTGQGPPGSSAVPQILKRKNQHGPATITRAGRATASPYSWRATHVTRRARARARIGPKPRPGDACPRARRSRLMSPMAVLIGLATASGHAPRVSGHVGRRPAAAPGRFLWVGSRPQLTARVVGEIVEAATTVVPGSSHRPG